eukprot:TRINITY_DN17117_c0_g1_i1.p1 TRINITY_DN17117_c0_g1~~TRINITY_DN17117_c0_g1_i1.p1  ORF type:complete len:163 (+),score=24.06 TRINITY_DN17117_c0_g1_i1:137-625(+)
MCIRDRQKSMAGASAKKNAAKNATTLSLRFNALVAVNVAFLLWRGVYHYASFSFWSIVFMCMAWVLYFICYSQFKAAASSGLHDISNVGEYWNDVFWVTLVAHAFAILTNWGWLVMLIIPGYMLVAAALRWAASDPEPEEETDGPTKKVRKAVTKTSKNATR